MYNTLSTKSINLISQETTDILMATYEGLAENAKTPPDFERLYDHFKERWINEMHTFLTINKDAWEVDVEELTKNNIDVKLDEWGFKIPSYNRIFTALQSTGFAFFSFSGELINGPVVETW